MSTDADKIAVSSGERWWGWSTAYGYQTSVWLGRLRLHVFWREDPGDAFHDHPWDYTTFPLTSYVEQVLVPGTGGTYRQVVPALRRTRRPASHAHRIVGRWDGVNRFFHEQPEVDEPRASPRTVPGAVITLVWRSAHKRDWFYLLVGKDFRVHRMPWRAYLARAEHKPRRTAGG